ncbi:guanine nucleotide-binding protein-like 3 homolog [Topomyia yanbarensis]|uniref:guanine nucleotide-binding protein-like 3 homolog n=1 Tax=Topomyia yanbarensis TaxID=2498891 RepID=UPI00273B1250|nr:guanine nucleotide-binding protein-like 3 homolog [Topomyia yanbarensis]
MALKALKCRSSKRQKASLRYKVIKKIAASKRKKEKEAKKLPKLRSKKQKLIQVPNICPFKKEILEEVAEHKQFNEQEKERKRELLKQQRQEALKGQTIESIAADADKRGKEYDPDKAEAAALKDQEEYTNVGKGKEGSLRAYFKEFKKVIDAADVVLEVVDARDPLGTRCAEVAHIVREAPGQKRLVLILNKADLVPRENLEIWLKYLRKSGPVIPFKATTQTQKYRIGNRKFKAAKTLECSPCIGADLLKELLANYCRSDDIRTSIRVGIVGLPNVGKSSLVNSLKRKRACLVGAKPGITKQMQEVQIDSHVKLIDSPGIIFQRPKEEDHNRFYALKNAQKVTEIQDPFPLAADILKRGTMSYFCKLYDISEFHSPDEFLAKKAIKMGALAKKGIPDVKKAARTLIEDWNAGKIKYCTHPPEDGSDIHVSAQLVSTDVPEFKLDSFDQVLKALGNEYEESFKMKDKDGDEVQIISKDEILTMEIDTKGPVSMQLSKEDEKRKALDDLIKGGSGKIIEQDDQMASGKGKKRKVNDYAEEEKKFRKDPMFQLDGNKTVNKNRKAELKAKKKAIARGEKRVTEVADDLKSLSFGGQQKKKKTSADDYDFDNDYQM